MELGAAAGGPGRPGVDHRRPERDPAAPRGAGRAAADRPRAARRGGPPCVRDRGTGGCRPAGAGPGPGGGHGGARPDRGLRPRGGDLDALAGGHPARSGGVGRPGRRRPFPCPRARVCRSRRPGPAQPGPGAVRRLRRGRGSARCGTGPARAGRAVDLSHHPGGVDQHPASLHRRPGHGRAARRRTSGSRAHAEIEITDDGRPRPGSSGSGLGLLGVRERAASQRAQVEIGPRVGGGYRVRVRFPLGTVSA